MKRILFLSVFGFLLSACGSGETDGGDVSGTTGDSKTGDKVVYAIAGGNSTKAKVYLGAEDDIFTVSNSGMTVYGNTGNDAVTIASGVTTVTLDQNIEQINLSGASTIYKFRQTGNLINVYDTDGTTLIVKAPVQGDVNGTMLSFSDGRTASALLSGGIMTLGGAQVASGTPTALNIPATTSTTTTTTSTTTTTTIPTGSVTVKW
jgi:hypothetical protein